MTTIPEVSILTATRDRGHRLGAFFDAIAHLAVEPQWELIIINNGSHDGTRDVLLHHQKILGRRMSMLDLSLAGKSRALNAGLRLARGGLLAFIDDDCYVAPDYVERIIEVFARRQVDFGGGRLLPLDAGDEGHAVWTSRMTLRLPPHSYIRPGTIHGGNMFVTRRLIDAIGGFDERLGPGTPFGCEDIDIIARATEQGFTGGVFPGPVVYHHHGRNTKARRRKQQHYYDVGRGAHYCKRILTGTMPREHAIQWLRAMRPWRTLAVARELRGALHYLYAGQSVGK